MTTRIWIIAGATSAIAERFAHIAANNQQALKLLGRDQEQLDLIAQDIRLRFKIECVVQAVDLRENTDYLATLFDTPDKEYDLFIAHSDFSSNNQLTDASIQAQVQLNLTATLVLINHYLKRKQEKHQLIYLSSVAACRGRSKNSLYGGTKRAVEVFLQGVQQAAPKNTHISIARLGFIDTRQTYGLPGIFYAAPPEECAQACWDALRRRKRMFYYPKFWWFIMSVITCLPFFVYKRMGNV